MYGIQIHKSIQDEVIIQLNTTVIQGVILSDSLQQLFNFRDTWLSKWLNRAKRLEAKPELVFIYDDSNRLLTIFPTQKDQFWQDTPFTNFYTHVKSIKFKNATNTMISLPKPWYVMLKYMIY